jgi:hypothetical protein
MHLASGSKVCPGFDHIYSFNEDKHVHHESCRFDHHPDMYVLGGEGAGSKDALRRSPLVVSGTRPAVVSCAARKLGFAVAMAAVGGSLRTEADRPSIKGRRGDVLIRLDGQEGG